MEILLEILLEILPGLASLVPRAGTTRLELATSAVTVPGFCCAVRSDAPVDGSSIVKRVFSETGARRSLWPRQASLSSAAL